MVTVRLRMLVMLCVAVIIVTDGAEVLAKFRSAEIRTRRQVGTSSGAAVIFPDVASGTGQVDQPILSEAQEESDHERDQRSPDADYEDYGDEEDGPEGRHLKHKLKRKFKPHKFKPHGGGLGSLLGGLQQHGGYGGHGGHGGYGGHGGGCRKLHGCGGGWQQPSHYGGYGGGPIAAAFAGPGPGYGGWRPPGYGGGYRPGSQAQVASWNFGPFQATFGLAQAG